jgi:hypothetical protein
MNPLSEYKQFIYLQTLAMAALAELKARKDIISLGT